MKAFLKGVSALSCAAFLGACSCSLQAQTLVNIANAPGVKYSYLDEKGNRTDGSVYKDKDCKLLSDGSSENSSAIASVYGAQKAKTVSVLFEFPARIHPASLEFEWMWGHNPKQWFDRAVISIGDNLNSLKTVASYNHIDRVKSNSVTIKVPLEKVEGSMVLVSFSQDAAADVYQFGIGDIRIMAPESDLQVMKLASEKRPHLRVDREYPCNIFELGKDAKLRFHALAPLKGTFVLKANVYNYYGDLSDTAEISLPAIAVSETEIPLSFKALEPGYYSVEAVLEWRGEDGGKAEDRLNTSIGMAKTFKRSAAEALEEGCRFGIQTNFGSPESFEACTVLGLQWFRALLCYGPFAEKNGQEDWTRLDTLISEYCVKRPGIGLFEIKTFPLSCYDSERYGKEPVKSWVTNTVPLKEPYQKFIREQIKRVPANQKYFEVWNEPWDGLKPEDFAKISVWTTEAIKQVRSDAVVGPNLGPGAYTSKAIDAGAFAGADMMTVHPYSDDFRSSPEAAGLRERIRGLHQLFKEKLGRDLPLYVTEIGWPTPPEGPFSGNSEKLQARYIVRSSLALYAEDVKAVMPYCLGQSEKDKNEKEHFFGFVRNDMTPKPVLLAYANMARMIDGSEFAGDVNLGKDVGAMLFKKKKKSFFGSSTIERILVLYTDNAEKSVLLRPGVSQLTVTDIMGREKTVDLKENRLSLRLSDDPIYISGFDGEIDKLIVSGVPQWSNVYKRGERKISGIKLPEKLNVESDLAVWKSASEIKVSAKEIKENDASAIVKAAWDEKYLYFFMDVTDDQPGINGHSGYDLWRGDAIEFFISSNPDVAVPGFLKQNDYQLLFSPFSSKGSPEAFFSDAIHRGQDISGIKYSVKQKDKGWIAEIAVPFKSLGIEKPSKSMRLGMEAALDDLDQKEARVQMSSNGRHDNAFNAAVWSVLILE